MNDQLKSNLTTAYMLFVFEFADPTSIDKAVLKELEGELEALFDKQRSIDMTKKKMTKLQFNQVLALYFNLFQSASGVDHKALKEKLEAHKKNFVRHLGKDKLAYLNLIVSLMKSLDVKKRGLLAA